MNDAGLLTDRTEADISDWLDSWLRKAKWNPPTDREGSGECAAAA